jgi:hypothetical protein
MSILAKLNPPLEGTDTIPIPDLGTVTPVSGSGAFVANIDLLHDLLRKCEAGGFEFRELADLIEALEEQGDKTGHMGSVVKKRSGIDNTLFVSTKGRSRHAPRIKIAINPPDSLNEASDGIASIALHDFSTVGAYIPPRLVEQVEAFIELDRDALLEYWDAKIDTGELLDRLKPVPPKK